ncbi:MAG TPA: hypothetical protein VHX44_14035, partial [Planctomycetota bacterium]|nr:hypothetical protein [Planctomycetota bacterium]
YRADWHSEVLAKVLKEVEKQTAPIVPSEGMAKIRDTQLVTLIDTSKTRLRDTLEVLERTQDLHITAEPLRLFVETWTDFRDRKRHLVNLALRNYGMFVGVRDFPGPQLGYGIAPANHGAGGGGFSLYKQDDNNHSAGQAPDPSQVVDWLRELATDAPAELRGNGNLYLMVTDEEEVAIRAALEQVQHRLLEQTTWRVSFGTLPAGQAVMTGLTSHADADAIIPRLQTLRTLTLSALNGQRTHSVDGHQQSLIDDLDVVNYQFDPKVSVMITGIAADLRPTIGSVFTHVSYQLSWVDPLPFGSSALTNPARIKAGSSSTTTTTTITPGEKTAPKGDPKNDSKGDGKGEATEKPTTTTVTDSNATEGGDLRPGITVAITKPVLWTWMPRGEVMLPKDRAMVLATEHPAGTAVMILETQP